MVHIAILNFQCPGVTRITIPTRISQHIHVFSTYALQKITGLGTKVSQHIQVFSEKSISAHSYILQISIISHSCIQHISITALTGI